ncbi:MAG: hypothetical protein KAT16_03755 [Candidatus Heimdallarchaeota archaeon]|nr:hypothetical protein [Candidatus Heimdallarchaeota archaeon]
MKPFPKSNRVAVLVHGFVGKKTFMKEVEASLCEAPFDKIYRKVINLSLYSSSYGLDLSKPYDITTPIYSDEISQTLAHFLLNQITDELEDGQVLDVYAHSLGGLVTRAMIRYLFNATGMSVKNVILLGVPNQGTRLAQKIMTIPADILMTVLNILFEIPSGELGSDNLVLFRSQFMQLLPNSPFLKALNKPLLEIEKSIQWITVRGLKSTGQLAVIWQPFLFRKFWVNRRFPFLHKGMIPNDGVVDAESVPLNFAMNFTVPNATHMDLLSWKSKSSGKDVQKLLKPIILKA